MSQEPIFGMGTRDVGPNILDGYPLRFVFQVHATSGNRSLYNSSPATKVVAEKESLYDVIFLLARRDVVDGISVRICFEPDGGIVTDVCVGAEHETDDQA